jgi:hypothetical protein
MEHHVKALGYDYLRDVVHLRSGQPWSDRLLGLINEADIFQLFWSSLGDYLRHKFKDALVQAGGAPADFPAFATKTAVFVLNTVSCLPA